MYPRSKSRVTVGELVTATATVDIEAYAPVTYNDPALTERMLPTLAWAAGADAVHEVPRIMGAEDFAFFQERIPGFYFFLGVNRDGVGPWEAAPNHSPYFFANEQTLVVGVRALAGLAVEYLTGD